MQNRGEYSELSEDFFNENPYLSLTWKPTEALTNETNYKVLNTLWSRFSDLDWKVFLNKHWEKLLCKFVDKKKDWKRLTLEGSDWEEKASLKFSYMDWFYYLDQINAYDHWKWNWWVLLDEFIKKTKWKKVFLQDNAYIRDGMSDTYLRLKSFYEKRWFKESKIDVLKNNNVLFKWEWNEWKIMYKYYLDEN